MPPAFESLQQLNFPLTNHPKTLPNTTKVAILRYSKKCKPDL
jgi:hypothetical protein